MNKFDFKFFRSIIIALSLIHTSIASAESYNYQGTATGMLSKDFGNGIFLYNPPLSLSFCDPYLKVDAAKLNRPFIASITCNLNTPVGPTTPTIIGYYSYNITPTWVGNSNWITIGYVLSSCNPGHSIVSRGPKPYGTCGAVCNAPNVWNSTTNKCIPVDKTPLETCGGVNATPHPIKFANGNKVLTEQDYVSNSSASPVFTRQYNSSHNSGKVAGVNWLSDMQSQVITSASTSISGSRAIVIRANGLKLPYTFNGTDWLTDADVNDKLTELKDVNGLRTGWSYINDALSEVKTYDAVGKLISTIDRAGLKQTLTYDANNRIISITDLIGRSLNFTYEAGGRIATMTNPAGGVYNYVYSSDNNNNLISVTYPDGKTKTYHYEDSRFPNALTGVTDENSSRYMTYTYDVNGRAVDEISPTFGTNVNHYGVNYNPGVTTVVTDPLGTSRTYNFTTILGVVKSTGQSQPAGSGCAASASSISYDSNGNVATRNDFNGNRTSYRYDMTRNLETSRTEGLTNAGAVLPETRTITTTWHPTWRLPLVIATYTGGADTNGIPLGSLVHSTTNTYDTRGNITSVTETDPVANKTRTTSTNYTYSSVVTGLVLTKVIDGPRTDVNDITTYTYYPHDATCAASTAAPIIDPITNTAPANLGCRGQLQSMVNALGHTTQFTRYNHHGQVEQMVDSNNVTTEMTYDLRQRMLSQTIAAGTPQAATTQYEYDGVGQLTKLTRADGSFIQYTYDAAHRLTNIADTLGNSVNYTLDAMGNITQTDHRNQDGSTVKRDNFSYDALNRLEAVLDGNNNLVSRGYDANGNLTTNVDGKGKLTQYTIDKRDRTTNILDALGGNTLTNYNAIDQSVLVKAPNNAQTTYTINALGDTTQELSPNRGSTNATYDLAGNAQTISDARGILSTTTWDALNRPLTTNYPQSGENRTYVWDAMTSGNNTCTNGKGRLCQITDAGGITKFAYDARGNLLTKTRSEAGITQTSTYSYDAADRLLNSTIPSGKLMTTQRNLNGEIEQVTSLVSNGTVNATTTLVANISTNALGQTTAQTFGNNITQNQSFNLMGTLASLDYLGNDPDANDGGNNGNGNNDNADIPTLPEWGAIIMGGLLMLVSFAHRKRTSVTGSSAFTSSALLAVALLTTSFVSSTIYSPNTYAAPAATLDYDANQNIISRTTPLGTTTYGYDDLNRLNSETGPAKTQSINYDANANRTSTTSPLDGSKTYTYTPNTDRLATINGQSISMDAMGNTLTARGYTYTWNQAGQLKEVKLGTGGSAVLLATYTYDYKNLRSRKETTAASPQGASTVLYTYDEANHLQTEIRANNGIATPLYSYVWRDDIPVAVLIHPAAQIAANPTFVTNPPANFNPNADQVIYLEVDHLNTPRIGRDQSGKKVWSWESDAFGSTLANEDPDNDGNKVIINLRFPGQQFDQESGLHYNHHRYYDPQLGRYTNSDPSGLAGGINTYAYANLNPLTYTDSLGLMGRGAGNGMGYATGSVQVGAGGSFHYGPGGASAESGVATGSNGSVCFYTQVCGNVGFGLAGSLGGSAGAQPGDLCSGEQESEGPFLSGGSGIYGGGQVTQGSDGNAGVGKGFGGVGAGLAGGMTYCTTRYYCVNEPKSCQKKCK